MKLDAAALTTETARQWEDFARKALAAGQSEIDLAAVKEVDSAAVALLLQWKRDAQASGQSLRFTGVSPQLASLATLYGMNELLGTPAAAKTPTISALHPEATPS